MSKTDEITNALNSARKQVRQARRTTMAEAVKDFRKDPMVAEKCAAGAAAVLWSALIGGPTLGFLVSGVSFSWKLGLLGGLTALWGVGLFGCVMLYAYLEDEFGDERRNP